MDSPLQGCAKAEMQWGGHYKEMAGIAVTALEGSQALDIVVRNNGTTAVPEALC